MTALWAARRGGVTSGVVFAAVLAVACGSDDIVVASLPVLVAGAAGQSAGIGGAPPDMTGGTPADMSGGTPQETAGSPGCASNDDCSPSTYCARAACGDQYGDCEQRPPMCPPDYQPSCGCDGVSYWNDCARKQAGGTASAPEACAKPATCFNEDASDCPVPASRGGACQKLIFGDSPCEANVEGNCWVLPDNCAQAGWPDLWMACDAALECRDVCSAMRSGRPFHQVSDMMGRCPGGPGPGR